MPCEPITNKDGKMSGWFCSRSRAKSKPSPCYKCGKPATRLCDFRDYEIRENKDGYGKIHRHGLASISTCDRPMCVGCSNEAGSSIDFCDEHFNEFDMERAKRAEKIHKERVDHA